VDKSLIDKAVVFVTDDETAEAADPGDRAFNLPAAAVAPQLPAVLRFRSAASSSMRTDQVPSFGQQTGAKFVAVLSSIGNQGNRRFADRHFVDQFFDERDLSRRSTFGPACKWNSLTICHHQPLRTFSTLGFANFFAPFLAGEKLASTNTSSQSSNPRSSSVSRKDCQISTSTPSPSHSTNLRQQVLGDGYRSGKSRQRAPQRNTHKIPSKHARSSAGGRPPRADRLRFGMNGLILSHCLSVTKTSCRRAIERSPFNGLDNVTPTRAQV
jgi:hypothetical protein